MKCLLVLLHLLLQLLNKHAPYHTCQVGSAHSPLARSAWVHTLAHIAPHFLLQKHLDLKPCEPIETFEDILNLHKRFFESCFASHAITIESGKVNRVDVRVGFFVGLGVDADCKFVLLCVDLHGLLLLLLLARNCVETDQFWLVIFFVFVLTAATATQLCVTHIFTES